MIVLSVELEQLLTAAATAVDEDAITDDLKQYPMTS